MVLTLLLFNVLIFRLICNCNYRDTATFDGTGRRNSQLEYGIAHDFDETGFVFRSATPTNAR